MNKATNRTHSAHRRLPALLAVGGSLAAIPAAGLELGDIDVQSRLGQPLRASIAYALAPHEQITKSCVSLRQGASRSGLPGVGNVTLRVANGIILLSGTSAMREPMVSAHIDINCPYSPNLSREYMLFIDPAAPAYEPVASTLPVSPGAEPVAATPSASVPTVRREVRQDIAPSTEHRVLRGESLSEIAARIRNRGVGLWPAVNAIFAANPHAFMNNDPNQLKAGSLLSIPSFNGSPAVVAAATPDVAPIEPTNAVVEPEQTVQPGVQPYAAPAVPAPAEIDATVDLKPGDIVLDDNPFVEPAASVATVIIPDTQLEGPVTRSNSPSVPTAVIRTSDTANTGAATPSWLLWLAGSGVALIIGLLLFARRFRGDTDATPFEPAIEETRSRRIGDRNSDTENLEVIDVQYDISDESPTEENLILDADLVIGTGLAAGEDSEVAEDFGFAASAEVDFELPFEPVATAGESTDILPPMHTDEQTILMSEVLPEDDDYDMSVIVDATKMPMREEVTERDLKAVVVESDDETLVTNGYTINKDVDYDVLEQDYEDELTATQALNDEIAKAAAELAERMDVAVVDKDETSAMPLASVTELDITAQMPAQNDDVSDLDDTGITEEITVNHAADESTVEMPVEKTKVR